MSISAKIIGGYEILVGAIGAIISIFQMIDHLGEPPIDSLYFLNSSFGLALFFFCCYAGYRLLERKLDGYTLSIWVQTIQIPKFMIAGFAYAFNAGFYPAFGLHLGGGFAISLNIFTFEFQFGFIVNEPISAFTINLGAACLAIYLLYLLRFRKIEERLPGLTACPYCSANLIFDKERFLKESGAFCCSCNNAIRLVDFEKRWKQLA